MTKEIIQEYLNSTTKNHRVDVLDFKEVFLDTHTYLYKYQVSWNDMHLPNNNTGNSSVSKDVIDEFIRNKRDAIIDEIIKDY
jgi:hypothetical protein